MLFQVVEPGVCHRIMEWGGENETPGVQGAAEAPGGVQGQRPGGGFGGRSPPEAEAFYSSKIELEPLGSTQITKMDSNNWDTLDSLYNSTLFGNSDSCSPPIFSKDKWTNNIFGCNSFENAPMNGQKHERI